MSPPPEASALFPPPAIAPATMAHPPLAAVADATTLDVAGDTIDENLLLAETEELLAALDATAFIASPVSTEDDEEEGEYGDSSESVTSSVSHFKLEMPSDKAAGGNAETAPATTGKKRVRSRDRTKDELVELRRTVVDLEQHLVSLRRSTTFMGKGKRNVTQTWGEIAKRQLRDRQRAEAENQYLKSMLLGQLSLAGRFDHSSNKRQLVAIPDFPGSLKQPSRSVQDAGAPSAASAAMIEELIGTMDDHYADMAGVFRANGIDQWPHEPQTYAQTKTQVVRGSHTPQTFLELVEVRLIPFPVRSVGAYLWESMKSWHHKNSSYAYPCVDRPDDTFAVGYRVQSRLGDRARDAYSASFKLVKRRYARSDGEVAVVWKSRSDGDQDLAGLSSVEIGWLVVSHVPAIDEFAPPTTALRACMQIFTDKAAVSPDGSGGGEGEVLPSDANRKLLRSLVVNSFEEDVNSINQQMENMLLEEALAQGGDREDAAATTGRIRYNMVE